MKKLIARVIRSPSMPVDAGDRWFIDGSLLRVLMFRGSAMYDPLSLVGRQNNNNDSKHLSLLPR